MVLRFSLRSLNPANPKLNLSGTLSTLRNMTQSIFQWGRLLAHTTKFCFWPKLKVHRNIHTIQNFEDEDEDDDLFFEPTTTEPSSDSSSTRRTRPTTPQRPTSGWQPKQPNNSTEYGRDGDATDSAAFIFANHILLICLYR